MLPSALWFGFDNTLSLFRAFNLPDLEFWARWLSIVIIDLTLAGDNALVIALAVRTLPKRQQTLGRIWGSLGGIILRVLFIAVVTFLFEIPLLQLAAGLLLVWIALRLIRKKTGIEGHVRQGATLLEAIGVIVLADVVMSLDNVLAVAAVAEGNLALAAIGVSLSLPLVVWGSGILDRLMNRYPWVIWIGGGILGYASGQMVLKDPMVQSWLGEVLTNTLRHPLPLIIGVVVTILGWLPADGRRRGG